MLIIVLLLYVLVNKKLKYKFQMFIYSILERYDDLIVRYVTETVFILLVTDFDIPFGFKSSMCSVLDRSITGYEYQTARQSLTTIYNREEMRPSKSEISIVIVDRFSKIITENCP